MKKLINSQTNATKKTFKKEVREVEEKLATYINRAILGYPDRENRDICYGEIREDKAIDAPDGFHYRLQFWRIGTDSWMIPEDVHERNAFRKEVKDNLTYYLNATEIGKYIEDIRLFSSFDRGYSFYNAQIQFRPDVVELLDPSKQRFRYEVHALDRQGKDAFLVGSDDLTRANELAQGQADRIFDFLWEGPKGKIASIESMHIVDTQTGDTHLMNNTTLDYIEDLLDQLEIELKN